MTADIRIPEISENVSSGTVVEVFVKPGDRVEVDDVLMELETDKAVVEIPSPYRGKIVAVLARKGESMNVGDVIATIATETATSGGAAPGEGPESSTGAAEGAGGREAAEADSGEGSARESDLGAPEKDRPPVPASPSVRRFAREMGVEIRAVAPAVPGGRIAEADVKAHVKRALAEKRGGTEQPPGRAGEGAPALPDFSRWGEVELRELTGVRRLTARSMAASWREVAHVTQFDRADVTDAMAFVARRGANAARPGAKPTLTAVVMKVCAAALARFPEFNASIDPVNARLILKKYVHIGIAVDTPRGLLVPVVRDADRKSILDLAADIADLAARARDKKIRPEEMEGGSFTLSNQGGIGGTNFTPLVFWPQAAILGLSRAAVEPRYMEGELRPRTVLPLALSYDHRIVDGADAARFLGWIRGALEEPLSLHLD